MKWLALRIGGQSIAVHLVAPNHRKLLGGCDGVFWPEDCAIYISRALAIGAREDVLFHELDHAVNSIAGITAALKEWGRKRQPKPSLDELEERLVRARTPLWHALLKDLGFRFPKGPTE